MKDYTIRELHSDEIIVLEDFLYEAIYQPDENNLMPREIVNKPEINIYINNWGKKDDLCLAAETDGKIVGAVWARILTGEIKGYGNIDGETPELAIALYKNYRGRGIGKALMESMISLLREKGYHRVSLSVEKDNYAHRLYEAAGFKVLQEREQDLLMAMKL